MGGSAHVPRGRQDVHDLPADPKARKVVCFKATAEDFFALTEEPGIDPAPYMAKNSWVAVRDLDALDVEAWRELVGESYRLVRSKLPQRVQKQLG